MEICIKIDKAGRVSIRLNEETPTLVALGILQVASKLIMENKGKVNAEEDPKGDTLEPRM